MSSRETLQELRATIDTLLRAEEPKDAKARTRARILRAATEQFQRVGYRRTSVDEVARESGVAKGTVYIHFKNKNELLYHAIVEEKKRFIEIFRPLFAEGLDPTERLRTYVELAFRFMREAPLSSKLLSGDREMWLFVDEMEPEHRAQLQTNTSAFLDVFLSGVGAIDGLPPEERARRGKVLMALISNAVALSDERARAGVPPDEWARLMAKIIVAGIGVE